MTTNNIAAGITSNPLQKEIAADEPLKDGSWSYSVRGKNTPEEMHTHTVTFLMQSTTSGTRVQRKSTLSFSKTESLSRQVTAVKGFKQSMRLVEGKYREYYHNLSKEKNICKFYYIQNTPPKGKDTPKQDMGVMMIWSGDEKSKDKAGNPVPFYLDRDGTRILFKDSKGLALKGEELNKSVTNLFNKKDKSGQKYGYHLDEQHKKNVTPRTRSIDRSARNAAIVTQLQDQLKNTQTTRITATPVHQSSDRLAPLTASTSSALHVRPNSSQQTSALQQKIDKQEEEIRKMREEIEMLKRQNNSNASRASTSSDTSTSQ